MSVYLIPAEIGSPQVGILLGDHVARLVRHDRADTLGDVDVLLHEVHTE